MRYADRNITSRTVVTVPVQRAYPRAGRDRTHARVIPVVTPDTSRAQLARRLV